MKVVTLDKLVQVHVETLKSHTQMVAEIKVVCHTNIVISIFWILYNEGVSKGHLRGGN